MSAPLVKSYQVRFDQGTGLNQADKAWADQRTIAPSGTDDLDMNGLHLDPFGVAFGVARVKGLLIAAAAANTNNVLVGNGVSNQFLSWVGAATHSVTVRPGGLLCLFAPDATGYVSTAGTADILRITNSGAGTSVTYDVVVIGAST